MNYPIISTRTSALFPRSYDGSRARFRNNLDTIHQLWPRAQLQTYRLSGDEELTIDWISSQGVARNDKLLVITTGEHGIEAYVGSAILQLLIDEYLTHLDPARTGLLLVHAINPWGMKYWRRVNGSNVDLNRNFIWEKMSETEGRRRYDPNINLDYERLQKFLNPQRAFSGRWLGAIRLMFGFARAVSRVGVERLSAATTLGQYHTPNGIYFGGVQRQEETSVLVKLFREHFRAFRQILLLDMHTGYGPRYEMSLVNSPLEVRETSYFIEQFGYPSVVKTTPEDFYGIQGDMIDYVYRLVIDEFPDKGLYATTFEFGTLGESTLARLRSLWAMILENQVHHFGANTQAGREFVGREFRELFYPTEPRWRQQAVLDSRQALMGILEGKVSLPSEHALKTSGAKLKFLSGIRAELPILLGVIPFGMIYGVLAVDAGMTAFAAQAMSSVVFAGSAQFVTTQLYAAAAPALVIFLTNVVVNLRHALYSASVASYVQNLGTGWKWLLAYLLTDEVYAVTITYYRGSAGQPPESGVDRRHWFFLGSGLALWTSWQISTAVGIFVGAQVPDSWSLDFTLPLTFIALVVPALEDRPSVVAALVGGVGALFAFDMPLKLGLMVASIVGIFAGLLWEKAGK